MEEEDEEEEKKEKNNSLTLIFSGILSQRHIAPKSKHLRFCRAKTAAAAGTNAVAEERHSSRCRL